jgi:lipoyl(octanoyl) transferase
MTLEVLRSASPVPYRQALEYQRKLHARRVSGSIPDTLWLLEHPPVITTGIRRDQISNILINPAAVGTEVVETERGGEVTYHGPGQLVGYLFVSMENHGFRVKSFVEKLENGFIDYLAEHHGIAARHDAEHTGVWVGMEKITAIGIALRQRVTLHGFAFNVNTNLSHFSWIVPCGIADGGRGVTSLEKLNRRKADFDVVAEQVAQYVGRALGYQAVTPERPFGEL